jgi:hypothetical protein
MVGRRGHGRLAAFPARRFAASATDHAVIRVPFRSPAGSRIMDRAGAVTGLPVERRAWPGRSRNGHYLSKSGVFGP